MNAKELAQIINGRSYTNEITKQEEAIAKAAGLVVVFGASDDLLELRGAINDEIGAWDGTWIYLTPTGLLRNPCPSPECPWHLEQKKRAAILKAIWDADGYSWIFEAPFPHETFEIMDDGEKYCRGIVFALADVPA
jgi:hypothetical protein